MKQSDGVSKPVPSLVTVIAMIPSFALLSLSTRTLPLGTAYVMWAGIGAVGTFLLGIMVLGEQGSLIPLIAAALIVSGLLLMKLSSSH